MKVHFQRISALLLAVLLSLSILAPSSMAVAGEVVDTGNFWTEVVRDSPAWLGSVIGVLSGNCALSGDGLHHGKVIDSKTDVDGTPAWSALCDYCSRKFTVYDTDMQRAYDQKCEDMQTNYGATIIDASGAGLISITGWRYICGTSEESHHTATIPNPTVDPLSPSVFGLSNDSICCADLRADFRVSVLGNYQFIFPTSVVSSSFSVFSCALTSFYLKPPSTNQYSVYSKPSSYVFSSFTSTSFSLSPDETYFWEYRLTAKATGAERIFSFQSPPVYLKSLQLFPSGSADVSIDSRVGSLTGNFVYTGDNGQQVNAENVQIVNEGNKTIYNPITGATTNITDWTYDYTTRTYTATTDNSQTYTVSYGDENVTIKEGDTVYNIYYMAPSGGGTVDPTPTPTPTPTSTPTLTPGVGAHEYKASVTTDATCLSAGVRTYTCTLCANTYTEKIPAIGHTWVLDRTINTEYDTEGNVTIQGYTIYKCSVCGNEYKDADGKGPPGGSGGEDDGGGGFFAWLFGKIGEILGAIGSGLVNLVQAALGKVLDGIIGIITMLSEKLETVLTALFDVFDKIPGMFSGFTAFLTVCFGFLPPEIITILIFGILALVLVAIFKLFLGK